MNFVLPVWRCLAILLWLCGHAVGGVRLRLKLWLAESDEWADGGSRAAGRSRGPRAGAGHGFVVLVRPRRPAATVRAAGAGSVTPPAEAFGRASLQQLGALAARTRHAALLGVARRPNATLDRAQPHHHRRPGNQHLHNTGAGVLLPDCNRTGTDAIVVT